MLQKSVICYPEGMPPRTEKLLSDVFAWCEKYDVNQVELARMLGLRPSHVTEWRKGRNLPNGETVLMMLELIKTKPKAKWRR
jgi:DNA-binding transcriptional regulator YiaG